MKKRIKILLVLCLIPLGAGAAITTLIKPFSESAIRRAGFSEAAVGKASANLHGITLENIKLDKDGTSAIARVHLFATLADLAHMRLTSAEIDNMNISIMRDKETGDYSLAGKPLTHGEAKSADSTFALPVKNLLVSASTLHIQTDYGDLPIKVDAKAQQTNGALSLQSNLITNSDFARLSSQLSLEVNANGELEKAQLDIADIHINTPSLEVKRGSGWIHVEQGFNVSSELAIGSSKLLGIPLQEMSLNSSYSKNKFESLMTGTAVKGAGNFSLNIKRDSSDATSDSFNVNIQTDLKDLDNLENINNMGIGGKAKINLALNGKINKGANLLDLKKWINIDGQASLKTEEFRLSALEDAADISTEATLSYMPKNGHLMLNADVIDGHEPAFITPFKTSIEFSPIESGGAEISGDISEKNGLFNVKVTGKHDVTAQKGNITFDIAPVTFMKGVTEFKEVSPISADYMSDTSGTLGGVFHWSWSKGKKGWETSSYGDALIKNAALTMDGNTFGGINSVLHLQSLSPIVLSHQTIGLGECNAGIPLSNGVLELSLGKDNVLSLHKGEWTLAKGSLSASPFAMNLKDMTTDVTLTAKALDLVELFKLAPMDGLDATGTVNGTIPLKIKNGKVEIVNGVLETTTGGSVRYSPKEVPSFLQGDSNKQIVDLRVALKAFDYETLKLTLNGEAGKTQKIGIETKGKNPEFYNGYPVSLKLNVEGPLDNVIKYNPSSNQIPDNIQKQIESYEKEHAAQKTP